MLRTLLAIAVLVLLVACTSTRPAPPREPAVLLVSIDGFHPDYLERGITPHLNALAARGVRARWMQPSYPSLTFPNHYTLVTGLRPDRHGIVGNRMWDEALGGFRFGERDAVADGRWWDDAEPIWVTARRAGLRSATLFWPGSEAEIRGLRPHVWLPYSRTPSPQQRVERVLRWLEQPHRPHFMTLYFEHVDEAGHRHGPKAPELDAAVAQIDAAIGQLVDGIAQRGLQDSVDIVIVSDHGMAAVHHVAALDEVIDIRRLRIITLGEVVGLAPRQAGDDIAAVLVGRHAGFECFRREAMPPQWQFGSHRRIPPIICQADEGWFIGRSRDAQPHQAGSHGYDPALPSMRALFIAAGPSLRRRVVTAPIDNVDVYPLLLQLLGIRGEPHDGDPRATRRMLRHPAQAERQPSDPMTSGTP